MIDIDNFFSNVVIKVNGEIANPEQKEQLLYFMTHILVSHLKKEISVLFRGNNLSLLKSMFQIEGDDLVKLNSLLFLFGEKSKSYLNEYQENQPNLLSNFKLSDCTESFFSKLFDTFHQIIQDDKIQNINHYNSSNKAFFYYFTDHENKDKFISEIQELSDKNKLILKDYYLLLLHQLGNVSHYKKGSFYCSTSHKSSVAHYFSDKRNSIILVLWWPYKYSNNYRLLTKLQTEKRLPYLRTLPYPWQFEYSMKCGILPHFLIGYFHKSKNEFIANPNIFKELNRMNDIIMNGLSIDQSDFTEKITETGFKRYFTFNNGTYFDSI